jgi:hypothetical protein
LDDVELELGELFLLGLLEMVVLGLLCEAVDGGADQLVLGLE